MTNSKNYTRQNLATKKSEELLDIADKLGLTINDDLEDDQIISLIIDFSTPEEDENIDDIPEEKVKIQRNLKIFDEWEEDTEDYVYYAPTKKKKLRTPTKDEKELIELWRISQANVMIEDEIQIEKEIIRVNRLRVPSVDSLIKIKQNLLKKLNEKLTLVQEGNSILTGELV